MFLENNEIFYKLYIHINIYKILQLHVIKNTKQDNDADGYFPPQGCSNSPYLSTRGWRAPPGSPQERLRPRSVQTASTSPRERRGAGSQTASPCSSAGRRSSQWCTSIWPWRHWGTWEMGFQTRIGCQSSVKGQDLVTKVGGVTVGAFKEVSMWSWVYVSSEWRQEQFA